MRALPWMKNDRGGLRISSPTQFGWVALLLGVVSKKGKVRFLHPLTWPLLAIFFMIAIPVTMFTEEKIGDFLSEVDWW